VIGYFSQELAPLAVDKGAVLPPLVPRVSTMSYGAATYSPSAKVKVKAQATVYDPKGSDLVVEVASGVATRAIVLGGAAKV
jgi:hypothetical protein